jgi:hypothetical protein
MAEAISHLRRQYAYRAVVRRESLVQLSHPTADAGRLLNQVHNYALVREIEGRLDTCDPSPYHHDSVFHSKTSFALIVELCVAIFRVMLSLGYCGCRNPFIALSVSLAG